MPQGSAGSAGSLVIPDDLREKYPDLIELILGSESMNDEERQYWINILPIMSPEQIGNLRGILENEKRQLAAIDTKYSKEVERIGQTQLMEKMNAERNQRRSHRLKTEEEALAKDEERADALLKMIEKP